MIFLKRLMTAWLALAALAVAAEDFGPVSIEVVPPMNSSFSPQGYQVHELRMRNRGMKPVQIHFLLRLRGAQSFRVERTVLLAASATAHTFLFHPNSAPYLNSEPLEVYIDGRRAKQTLHLNYRYGHSDSLLSPSLPVQDYRKLRFIVHNAEATSVTISQWGRHLRDYIGSSKIYLSSEDRLPPEVEEPIMQWVRLGGNLLICVPPEAPWPANVPQPDSESGIFEKNLGWGRIIYCRPITAADKKKADEFLETNKAAVPSWRYSNSEDKSLPDLGPASNFLRTSQAMGKNGPTLDSISLMPNMMNVPLQLLFCVMLFFAILIGPVNFWVLKRHKKEPWILVTTPIISLLFCGVVILFITFKEGWYSRGRAVALTLLDQTKQQAVTKGWMAVYAPIAPRSGFDFPMEACLSFSNNGDFTLNLNSSQHFDSGLIQPRIPLGYAVNQVTTRHERLQMQGIENGWMRLVNGLGGTLTALAVVGADGRIYHAEQPVAAGASVALSLSTAISEAKQFRTEPLLYVLRGLPGKLNIKILAERLPPGYYAAAADSMLFFAPGLIPEEFQMEQYIIGKYDTIGEEKHGN